MTDRPIRSSAGGGRAAPQPDDGLDVGGGGGRISDTADERRDRRSSAQRVQAAYLEDAVLTRRRRHLVNPAGVTGPVVTSPVCRGSALGREVPTSARRDSSPRLPIALRSGGWLCWITSVGIGHQGPGRGRRRGTIITTGGLKRDVAAEIEVEVTAPTTLEFQIAVARQPGIDVSESLLMTLNGRAIEPREVIGEHGTRIHTLQADEGRVALSYSASVFGQADVEPVRDIDLITYLRPSRYAEADKFFGFAATEFGHYSTSVALLEKVSSWVGTRLVYVPGSSDPIDGAADTLLAGAGVCRDYAHLVIALLRALYVPARLAAVYAPGCQPMDFHAVAEAFVDGAWRVVDATCLSPRQSMVRIATGRDAADTAFLDNHKGSIMLNSTMITAVVDGDLPKDSVHELVSLR